MKGVLLVTHSTMCEGVKESCEMIIGERMNIETLSLQEEGVEIFREKLVDKIDHMRKLYDDLIVVTDIPNATPYNECLRYSLSHERCLKIISGMNLAMIIELAIYSITDIDTDDLIKQIIETGKNSITSS